MKSTRAFIAKGLSSPGFGSRERAVSQSSVGPPDASQINPGVFNVDKVTDGPAPGFESVGRGPRPKTSDKKPVLPTPSQDTPPEMIPVLSLLTAHNHRVYHEGYFMLLNDLGNDARPVQNRQWVEVFGTLTGTQLATWDAAKLDEDEDNATPSYINITDSTFKSISTLPSPGGDLSNVIVLSTTMKNRFLLQFPSTKSWNEWTSALRLSVFENTSLQEAYTGALLSSKGSKLNGIRGMLGETRTKREDWCSVRFGAGMPWKRVWYVLTPSSLLKEKADKKDKKAGYGNIAFYESPKHVKKPPLATLVRGYSAHAVFPERAVLMNVSSLLKAEGYVRFAGEKDEKESSVFIMPEQHPGIQGFETLIRFIIPLLDIFQLYGRPTRLNADKADLRSLLFGMPTLPRAYYLDLLDVVMLTAHQGSQSWSARDWTKNIKEMLARKLATDYKGLGNIHDITTSISDRQSGSGSSKGSSPQIGNGQFRKFSETFPNGNSSLANEVASNEKPYRLDNGSRDGLQPGFQPVGKLPQVAGLSLGGRDSRAVSQPNAVEVPGLLASPAANGSNSSLNRMQPSPRGPSQPSGKLQAQRPAPNRPTANPTNPSLYASQNGSAAPAPGNGPGFATRRAPGGPRPQPHERSASEGQDPNNLIVNVGQGPLTPLPDQGYESGQFSSTRDAMASNESFHSTSSQAPGSKKPQNMFDPTFSASLPSHHSYAEYSEYMQAYLAQGLNKPPPTNPEEVRELMNKYRAQKAAEGGVPNVPLEPVRLNTDMKPKGNRIPPPINVQTPPEFSSGPRTPVNAQAPTFGSPSAYTSGGNSSPTNATGGANLNAYRARPLGRSTVNPYSPASSNSQPSSQYSSQETLPEPIRPQQQRRPSGPREASPGPPNQGYYQSQASPRYNQPSQGYSQVPPQAHGQAPQSPYGQPRPQHQHQGPPPNPYGKAPSGPSPYGTNPAQYRPPPSSAKQAPGFAGPYPGQGNSIPGPKSNGANPGGSIRAAGPYPVFNPQPQGRPAQARGNTFS